MRAFEYWCVNQSNVIGEQKLYYPTYQEQRKDKLWRIGKM
jgi:hypothetical protein